tara:strand:+ start:1673 stop:2422 length:750 start_codon:yes stop_codon:yes gene_type:complete
MSFSVILPTLNENGHITKLISEIADIFTNARFEFEIIVVDDNSDDGTYETVKKFQDKKPFLKVLLRKKGKKNLANSINDGIKISKFDNIIWLDADFQHPPKYIKDFIQKSENYDVIVSSRFLSSSERYFENKNFEKEINENQSYFYNKLCRFLLYKDITDYTSGFICVKKKFFKNYKLKGYYGDYFVDMIVNFKKQKLKIIEIPFRDDLRASGKSKTLVNINLKYIYTCIRYLLTLIISFLKSKIISNR